MATVIKEIELAASPEQVWSKVCDLAAYGDWNVIHTGFPDGTPTLSPDATFRESVTIMGMPGEVTWTVAELQENARLELDGAGPMGITLRAAYALEPSGGSTRFTMESSFDGAAIQGPMGDAVALQAGKSAEESLARLAGLLS